MVNYGMVQKWVAEFGIERINDDPGVEHGQLRNGAKVGGRVWHRADQRRPGGGAWSTTEWCKSGWPSLASSGSTTTRGWSMVNYGMVQKWVAEFGIERINDDPGVEHGQLRNGAKVGGRVWHRADQ